MACADERNVVALTCVVTMRSFGDSSRCVTVNEAQPVNSRIAMYFFIAVVLIDFSPLSYPEARTHELQASSIPCTLERPYYPFGIGLVQERHQVYFHLRT